MTGATTDAVTRDFAEGRLRLSRIGAVASITFDSPARMNAMTMAMWEALGDICEELAHDGTLRAVSLRGAGTRAFVAGADISEFAEKRSEASFSQAYNAAVSRAEHALEAIPVPTVALIRGYCIGGGLGLAMCCDLRLACAGSQFAVTPARLGLGYGYDGVARLHRRLGHAVTADLLFSGRRLDADEALARGIVDQLTPEDEFDDHAAAYLGRLEANAPLTIRAIKAALRDLARPEHARDPQAAAAMVAACFDSEDYREGQAAFAEKRSPAFRGR